MTECYLKEFEADIVNVIDGVSIILDSTIFYPNSGGQPNDLGVMRRLSDGKEFKVVDVIKKDGEIMHKVDVSGLLAHDKVLCIIDWDRRYKLMRYHTGSHILATLIHDETGAEITGNQLYLDKARVDFSLEKFDRSLMKGFEDKVNAMIARNLPVTFRILDRESAFKIPALVKLRKELPEHITEVRIVDIASEDYDFDHQACGGTHLKNTSEIGAIDIYDLENKGKDRKRIYFKLKDNN